MNREPFWTYSADEVGEVLRIFLLFKFGGFSIDFGIISLKNFNNLPKNFVCSKFRFKILSSILKLNFDHIGHDLSEEFLNSVLSSFKKIPKDDEIDEILLNLKHDYFQANYSGVESPSTILTEIIRKKCKNLKFDYKKLKNCKGLKVLPLSECPPAFLKNWEKLFYENEKKKVLEKIKNSHFLNVWNDQWYGNDFKKKEKKFKINSKSAIVDIMKEKCPRVFENLDNEF